MLKTGIPVEEAYLTDYLGRRLKILAVRNDGKSIEIALVPWAILNLELVATHRLRAFQ